MAAWVLAYTDDTGQNWYFTGRSRFDGSPRTSPFVSDAFHFTSPRGAYETAQTHKGLADSDRWRAVKRRDGRGE